jgi:glycosyltransferase involved in cell wall biosynthesis
VPRYRVPVFERLSSTPGLEVEIWADLSGRIGSLSGITASERIHLVHAPYRERRGIVWQPSILGAMRRNFDVVLLSWNVRSPHLFLSLALKRRPAVILWGHGFGTHHERFGGWLRRRTASMAEACLFYGPSGRERAIENGMPPDRLFVAPNAIDQAPIQAAADRWSDPVRRRQFLDKASFGGGPLMLFLSRLEPEKRPELAIEALALVRKRVPTAELAFIGDGSCLPSLKERVNALGLGHHVRFLGQLHDEDLIAPWALSADVLVHPGALGLTIFHAFGYGLPVITTDAMRLQMPEVEALEPGRNGLTYRHGDVADLADACGKVMLDRQLRERLSRCARDTVLSKGGRNVASMVSGMVHAIQSVERPGRVP